MKGSIRIVGGIVALLFLFGGAAFVGGRLLGTADPSGEQPDMMVADLGNVQVKTGSPIDVERAAEMPDAPADVAGLFVRREDNSVFVGTGQVSGFLVDGKLEQHHDGPVVEVVTTHDTQIYCDDILLQLGGEMPSGPVQQVLKPGSVEEVGPNSMIQVWGQRRGERLVADVLVFVPQP